MQPSPAIKRLIIIINILMLLCALYWLYFTNFEMEPIIVSLGFVATLVALLQNNEIALGGGILCTILIFVSLFLFRKDYVNGEFTAVTVFVHDANGSCDDLILTQGEINMTIERTGERKQETIDSKGQAKFSGIALGEEVQLQVQFSEPYYATHADSLYKIDKNRSICLSVGLKNQGKIFGSVIWKDAPLSGVKVSINSDISDTTNIVGYYELIIPKIMQQKEHEVKFYKSGYKMLLKSKYPQDNEPLNVTLEKF